LNASIDDDGRTVVHHAKQNLGIAVDTDRGLVVPVLKDAGDLNLLGLSRRIDELARRARVGALSPDDLSGGTFTLTNTGSRGALFDTPILLPGQVGILGTGAIVERPVVLRRPDAERVIAIRSMAHLALTYDHRLVDGSDAARFLGAIKARLEAAQFAAELG
jgi:2-oxoglutarate dehydrogenase E2 component (dihydrolipoamide succinyltransferase)